MIREGDQKGSHQPAAQNRKPLSLCTMLICCLALLLLTFSTGTAIAQENPITVEIHWPSEGETLYAGPSSLVYNIPVRGLVRMQDADITQVTVLLEIVQGSSVIGGLSEQLKVDGRFEFFVTVNPDHVVGQFTRTDGEFTPVLLACGAQCHFLTETSLPNGQVTLRITVTDPLGRQARVERQIIVDRSEYAFVPVQVVHENNPGVGIEGVHVSADTRIYLWRARHPTGITDENGEALMRMEALSQAPTNYILQVDPTIVGGIRYEGIESTQLTLPPGATAAPRITLTASMSRGGIYGKLAFPVDNQAKEVTVWAIHTSGRSFRTHSAADGTFAFTDLPADQYMVTADYQELAKRDLTCDPFPVDLRNHNTGKVDLPLTAIKGMSLRGDVQDEDGKPLSFGWVQGDKSAGFTPLDPDSGEFVILGSLLEQKHVMVIAPGYYSQEILIPDSAGDDKANLHIKMEKQPETKVYSWRNSNILIPPESSASQDRDRIDLQKGWIWGNVNRDSPILVNTASYLITIIEGDFALEVLPGQPGWLFIKTGEALVSANGGMDAISVPANHMISLDQLEEGVAVPANPTVLSVLRPSDYSPISAIEKPTIMAQIQERVSSLGINIAQGVTFATYSLVVLSALVAFVPIIRWWRKSRSI